MATTTFDVLDHCFVDVGITVTEQRLTGAAKLPPDDEPEPAPEHAARSGRRAS